MAALTPTSVLRESAGSLTLHIATFSAITDGDTYASGLGSSIIFSHAVLTEAAATTATPYSIIPINSSGNFTFDCGTGAASKAAKLMIYSRS